MKLTIKEKRTIETLSKKIIAMLPYLILIIVSIIFMTTYSNNSDFMLKVIKICLLFFDVFAIYALINKVRDLVRFLLKK